MANVKPVEALCFSLDVLGQTNEACFCCVLFVTYVHQIHLIVSRILIVGK
uniref:Uncharacterized protein n=1 Tax=Arundo donax TaxID=35708 RepID=A0A0A9A892_ARUDO